jgi:hypothetical protein
MATQVTVITGSGSTAYNVNLDRRGPQGIQGEQGEKGDQGIQGEVGPPGPTDYNLLTNVPATFPPSAHTHAVANITPVSTTTLIGRHAGGSGDAQEVTVGNGVEFSGSGIRRSALTGDVTASAGSNSTTIANDAVTNGKLANMATATIKGRTTAGTGDPEDLTAAQARTVIGVSPALVVSDTAPTPPVDGQQWLGLSSEILSIWSTTKNRWIVPVTEDFNSTVAAFYFFDATAVSSVVVADPLASPLLVAEWLSTAGPNNLGRKFVQATSLNQPRYVGSNRVNFNDSSDILDFDAAVSRAGWQIVGTSRGTYAYRVNANSITGINLFGNRGFTNITGDLYGIILLPADVSPTMIQKARQILIDRGATDEVVGTNVTDWWRNRADIVEFPLRNFSAVTNFQSAWLGCTSLTSFPLINTSSGTNFSLAWNVCASLTSFPLINTSSGTNFNNAWRSCTGLTSFPLINTASATTYQDAWRNCVSLVTFPANFFNSWTGTPVANCFLDTWLGNNSLTATSVENIFNSIDTSGKSAPATGTEITVAYNAASGTPNITTAVTNLKARGWTPRLNGTLL